MLIVFVSAIVRMAFIKSDNKDQVSQGGVTWRAPESFLWRICNLIGELTNAKEIE